METVTILKQIANDVSDIKKKLVKIEIGMDEFDTELHELRPNYVKKLQKIEKDKHYKFNSINELRKLIEDV